METQSHLIQEALMSASFAFATAEMTYNSVLACGFTDSRLDKARTEFDKARAEYVKVIGELYYQTPSVGQLPVDQKDLSH